MEIRNLEEFIDDVCNDVMCNTIDKIGDLYHNTCDIVMDILEEEGITLSEKYLIAHVLDLHSDILNDLINDDFLIEECCHCNCEHCPCAEEK